MHKSLSLFIDWMQSPYREVYKLTVLYLSLRSRRLKFIKIIFLGLPSTKKCQRNKPRISCSRRNIHEFFQKKFPDFSCNFRSCSRTVMQFVHFTASCMPLISLRALFGFSCFEISNQVARLKSCPHCSTR